MTDQTAGMPTQRVQGQGSCQTEMNHRQTNHAEVMLGPYSKHARLRSADSLEYLNRSGGLSG